MKSYLSYAIAWVLIILLVVVSLFVWRQDFRHRQELLHQYTENISSELVSCLEKSLKATAIAMNSWLQPELSKILDQTQRAQFLKKTTALFDLFPMLDRMVWLDTDGRIEWLYTDSLAPARTNTPRLELREIAKDIYRYQAVREPIVALSVSEANISLCWPVLDSLGNLEGYLCADLPVKYLVESSLPVGARDFSILLADGERTVYHKGDPIANHSDCGLIVVAREVKLGRNHLRLLMTPASSNTVHTTYLANLPILFIGLLIIAATAVFINQQMRQRFREQKENQAVLQKLTTRLMDVQETEQTRISGYLHDHVGQMLTMAKLDLEPAGQNCPPTARAIENALGHVSDALRSIRNLSASLRLPMIDKFGLPVVLETLAREVGEEAGIQIVFERLGDVDGLSNKAGIFLYRILQEALSNAVKHSSATKIIVYLEKDDDGVRLEVRDNGKGFDIAAVAVQSGIGLIGMRQRVSQFDGELKVRSKVGEGTSVIARIPVLRICAGSTFKSSQSSD